MTNSAISKIQVISNLRRSARNGLISLLDETEINRLFSKYYYDKNKGCYICPYTGKELRSKAGIVLEHIIPISCGGGTILFNVIPISLEANKVSEKGCKHLIDWWTKSNYFSPARLETLLDYMFDAYTDVLSTKTIEEIENSVADFIESDYEYFSEDADLSTTAEEEQDLLEKQANETGAVKYYDLLKKCIEVLSEYKDVTHYKNFLNDLYNNEMFKKIELYEKYYVIFQKIIKDKLDEESRRELTISLKYNLTLLIDSMKSEFTSEEDIYNEIYRRINNIDNILNENNITIESYFQDINNNNIPDILAIKNPSVEDFNKFIISINLCVADKFNAFVRFVIENKGRLPNYSSDTEEEKILSNFRKSIQKIKKGYNKFETKLSKEQLKYLHDSEYESLREIYKEILNRSIAEGITIDYIDENMSNKIREYNEEIKGKNLEEVIDIQTRYSEFIKVEGFNNFIKFVIENKGKLPGRIGTEEEKKLGYFRGGIQSIKKGRNKFFITLNKEQLKYLHDSEYESLRDTYNTIMEKAYAVNCEEYINYDIEIQKNKGKAA